MKTLSGDDLDRVVDRRWDPPVTLGVRLVSVVGDDLQHVGQAAFVRGLVLRGAGRGLEARGRLPTPDALEQFLRALERRPRRAPGPLAARGVGRPFGSGPVRRWPALPMPYSNQVSEPI